MRGWCVLFLLLCLLARVEELEFAASHARENQFSVWAGLGWGSDCRRPRFSGIIAPGTSCPFGGSGGVSRLPVVIIEIHHQLRMY